MAKAAPVRALLRSGKKQGRERDGGVEGRRRNARVREAQPVVIFKEGSKQQRPSHQVARDVASSDALPYRLKTRRGQRAVGREMLGKQMGQNCSLYP